MDETKEELIVSDEYEELGIAINERLGRSITNLKGCGGYYKHGTDVIYVVVTRLEISKFKQTVHDVYSNAFLTIMNTQEARGVQLKQRTIEIKYLR